MASYNYLPNTHHSALFQSRTAPGGVYSRLAKSFAAMGPAALANAEYNVNFFKHNFGESWSSSYGYRDVDAFEFTANVIGEIVGAGHGTLLGAQGNHYPGPNANAVCFPSGHVQHPMCIQPNLISDQTKVKNTLVLACPSDATLDISDIFHDQIVTAVCMRDADAEVEDQSREVVQAREFVKALRGNGEYDSIVLTSEPLYTVSQVGSAASSSIPPAGSTPRRPYKKRRFNEGEDDGEHTQPASISATHEDTVSPPSSAGIYVGAEYDRHLMPDYGGPLFDQHLARLVQPDWRDENNNLITPWTYHNKLRPGTVVVANVSFHVYVLSPNSVGSVRRKIYHAVIRSLKVVASSDVTVDPASLSSTVKHMHRLSTPSQVRRSRAAADAFESIARDRLGHSGGDNDDSDDQMTVDIPQVLPKDKTSSKKNTVPTKRPAETAKKAAVPVADKDPAK